MTQQPAPPHTHTTIHSLFCSLFLSLPLSLFVHVCFCHTHFCLRLSFYLAGSVGKDGCRVEKAFPEMRFFFLFFSQPETNWCNQNRGLVVQLMIRSYLYVYTYLYACVFLCPILGLHGPVTLSLAPILPPLSATCIFQWPLPGCLTVWQDMSCPFHINLLIIKPEGDFVTVWNYPLFEKTTSRTEKKHN